jgi:hypothetical protein
VSEPTSTGPRARPEVGSDPGRWRRRALIAATFVVATMVMLRPTPHSLTTTVPENIGDPVLNIWALMWGNHALLHQPLAYFDAPIFWPHSHALAYSESILPVVPFFGLIHLLTGNALLANNLSILALVLLSLASTYALIRRLTTRTDAAVFGALAYSFSGYALVHLGHLQLETFGFFPLAFLLLIRVLEERSVLMAAALGVVSAALVSASLYYGATYAVCLAVSLPGYLIAARGRPGPRLGRCLAVTGAVAGILLLPVALPYVQLRQEEDVARGLAPEMGFNLVDVVTPAPESYLYRGLAEAGARRPAAQEHAFFLGFSTLALAMIGAGATVRDGGQRRDVAQRGQRRNVAPSGQRRNVAPSGQRRNVALLAAAAAAATVLAAGDLIYGNQRGPFVFFHEHVPIFNGIRAVARLAVPGLLVLAVLAGVGLAWLTARLRRGVAVVVAVAACLLVLAELAVPPRRVEVDTSARVTAIYRELAARPDGVVAELPIIDPASPEAWAYVEAPRMGRATRDWKPRVNGYSGGAPGDYQATLTALNAFPDPAALAAVDRLAVRYLVLHTGDTAGYSQLTEAEAGRIVSNRPAGATAQRYGEAWLIDLGASPARDAAARTRD